MVKESKSAVTIRRRRFGDNRRSPASHHHKSAGDGEELLEEDEEWYEPVMRDGPRLLRLMLGSDKILFMTLLAFRGINALMIQTAYVPDEYWQSVEVAHNMAYGYGYLTWEWRTGLRGFSYPALFAALYKLLGILHLDNRVLLIKLPRLIQGLFAALGDLYLYRLSRKLAGSGAAQWALLCQLTSWFTFFCGPRTLSNSMETTLTTMALYYFPWPGKPRKAQWKYLSLVGLAIVMRPTAAIQWLPLCIWHAFMYRHTPWAILKLFAERGFIILSLSSIVDRVFYAKWVNVHYNFLQFNVVSGQGTFYGSHPWHWYLSQGFPVIMGTQLFPFILAARKSSERVCVMLIAWTICCYSCLGHKEFRFLFPILPLAMHVCGVFLHSVCEDDQESEVGHQGEPQHNIPSIPQYSKPKPIYARAKVVILFLVLTNLPLAMYTSVIHQRGTVDVMKFLHDSPVYNRGVAKDIMFLMPCHSTPYYSYLHQNVSMRFLTCEPNLQGQPNYVDEADVFYQNPTRWLHQVYTSAGNQLPTHLVMFNVLVPSVKEFLVQNGYQKCATLFHAHITEGRVGSHVMVYCLKIPIVTKSS